MERNDFLHVGFGNLVSRQHIVEVKRWCPGYAAIEMMASRRNEGAVIDMTAGRPTRTVIVMETGHRVLSAIEPEELGRRLNRLYWPPYGGDS